MSSFYVLAPATPTITTSYVPHGILTLQCFKFSVWDIMTIVLSFLERNGSNCSLRILWDNKNISNFQYYLNI